ncbi:fibrous sheath-interacting protein 2-like [Bos indicus x Bos taurus]|uniref:fibrous sheath-interacting protein 2-like n=1 Tax=Bos indicus x Bos taurus TaxID=30522 RepID=UPI000F7D0CE8|nr:fibrous sheath-interacting protein 2-like [Bos indicus x Bos taurus]
MLKKYQCFLFQGPVDEKVSISSTRLSKKYESKQPLRSINTDSSLNQFCEHLTELVISYIISSISDCTKDGETKQKSLRNEDTTCSEVILIHSQVFEHQSISIRGLALSISEVIIHILLNSDILKEDVTKVVSMKAKYIYCPKAAVADFSDLFQDLLIGVIHVLSKEIGINHHLDSKGKNKSLSTPKSHSLLSCNKAKTVKRQIHAKGWKSAPTHQLNQLIQKSKLNSLACKLNTLVGSLRSPESKEVVNKIFNIVFNLFLPDECPNWDTDSGKTARKMFLFSNNLQSHRIPRNNLGLSPKSAFLLNVVCEKLIRMLLEECTTNNFLTNSPLSDEISIEGQLFNTLQSIDDYSSLTMDYGLPFEEYDTSDLFENSAEIDQESMLSIISHSLVKSLMEKLSCGIQQPPRSPPVTDKHLTYRTSERLPSFPKAKRPGLKESKQGKNSARFMSYDSKPLTGPSDNLRVIHSKMQTPISKQFSGKFRSLPPLQRPDKKTTAFLNIQYPGGMNTGVYSATFLEEIIVDIFLNLTTSLQGKNVNITEAQLNEMNILDINCVVNEFNTAQVTVLRDIEEKMCFTPVYKETISKIGDSVYNDVSWDYTLQVTCSDHLAYAAMSIAEQITSGILKESIDYQLPLCFIRKLMPNSYHPLKAENILLKLQNNLSELNYQSQHSTGYITMLSYSFLADVIRRLLSQLILPPIEALCLGTKHLKISDFNEVSTCIINKVLLAISKHKIWLTKYDCQCVYTEQNLQNMVESIYNNILQMSDSLASIQKSIESQSPIMVDRMAGLIIQEIIENHLQPFLCEEGLPHSMSPLDEISNMVKEVLGEVTGSHRPQKSSSLGISFYPNAFVEEIVARLLSKVFNPKYNMECDLDKMTSKIVNSINNHFKKAKICILRDDQEQPFPTVDSDTMDELVNLVYKNVLKQYGLAVDSKELKDSDIFAENITNLIVAAISDYLFHPLFSGDLSASSYTILTAENINQNIFRGITKPTQPSQHLSPYNTLLPYTFLEEIIRKLLSRIFPSASNMVPYSKTPKDRSEINHSEISSKLISDIRMKISQHEIRFSKDEDETESLYSEDDVQCLVDSTLRNIGQNSGSQEAAEHDIISSDNVFIDRIASFIIKNICQQHLHPFLYGKLSFTSSYRYFDSTKRRHSFFASVYSSAFLEDVISGVLSKIFHRALGIVQTKSLRDSEKELLETAEKFIYLITKEFSKVQVSTLENAEEQLCLPPVDRDTVIKIINAAYSKVLQEYELEPNKDFFSDTKTLAERLTKIILAEVFDFQIPPYFIAKLPFKSYSKLNADVLIKRVHYAINTSSLRRQTCTTYTTILSHTHLEKIVSQVLSQISLLNCSAEDPYFLQSDFNNIVVRLIDEIMSIISKHAICIVKDGSEKQNVISENSIQAMVDAIYTDISHLKLYQSISKDKKGISNIPVTKIASYIIREIFNHHLESFLPGDKTLPCTMEQIYQQRAINPKQRELSFIVNSAVFLEEVISELLCKILCIFSYVLATENPCKAKANVTDIVTRLVKSIVLEFTTSQILVADHLHENLYFSEGYKEMVKKTVSIIYEKILDDYQSLFHIYRAIQNDAVGFGEKIYHLLLEEIYDYQVESLVLGKLETSSYSSLQEKNIIRNVLSTINNDSHDLPSCITVLPRSLLENMIYKILARMFPSPETEIEPNEEGVPPDYAFVNTASKLTDDIITEISEHEIRLAEAEEHVENLQLGATDDFVDSVCNNIIKKIKFEDEVQKDAYKRGGSFLGRIAGFIMKEIVDHHLQPFLCDEKSFPSDLPRNDDVIELLNPIKEKIQSFPQTSVYSAMFLEDVVFDLVRKFYTLPKTAESPKDKEISERSIMGLAIKFANVLIGEFRKSKIKVLTSAEKMFAFPPVNKETVDKVCDSVYDEVTEIYGSKNVQKHDRSNIVIEMVAALTKKAISAFKIQPLFSGGQSSTLFSYLDVDSIMQRIQHLPYKTFTKINRSLKENPVSSLEQLPTLIPLSSDLKNKMDTLEIDSRAVNGKENFKKKTSMKTGSIQQPICTNISSIMKSKVTTIALESVGGMAKKKKGDEKKKETSIGKDENISKLTSTTTSVKSKDTPGPDLGTAFTKNEIKKKDRVSRRDEKGRGDELYQHLSPAMNDTKNKVILEPSFEICCKKKSDKKKGSSLRKGDIPLELPSLTSKVRTTEIQEKRRDSPAYPATNDKQILHSKHAQNVPVSIYRNVLETSSLQGPVDDLNYPSLLGENAAYVTQACGKDFAQHASVNSAKQNAPAKEEENEIQRQPHKWDNPQNLLENKPRIFPANFLEDVIFEIVNKLIFSSSLDTYAACQNVTNDVNPAELYGMAMKLIDSLLKEFSDAQIKVLNPDQGIKFLPSEDNVSAVHKAPLGQKKLSVVKRPSKKKITMDNIPPIHNTVPATKLPSSGQTPFTAKIPSIDKMLVNKIVHSSICNILQDYRSQDSICEDINFNVEKLAKRLANAVIEEILQYQLNLLFYDEGPDPECLPLESKKVMKKVHKVAQRACKECQTSSPYTIMLPYEFLERIISSLLSRIFSTVANAKTEMSEDNLYTELDFLQMKLASTVKTEISKDEDMIIQYVKSLHPNDDEIIQLVVQTVYNNLLPQFGSQESIRKCISSGCKILSEAIVNLVVQEVTGNQLQNYFSGELTPLQCTEIDSTIENILRGVTQTSEVPQPQPSRAYKLPFNIIEEIAVKFLSKLLSMFPKADKEQNNFLNAEMQKISSKILSSFQQYISQSHITVVPQVKESSTVSLTDSATIEKVVTSVYSTVLKHSGSHISVYKDLMGKSNVLSDIIGFLMVKEISNSEFHPQEQEETSSSELVLEAVKIMEKVAKIIDDLKSKKKSPTKKEAVLDARFLEETLALFLAKLVKLPSASSKDAENLSKPELNKIASQVTKSVTAEISRKNISIVATNPEEYFLNPESIEIISQMVDSVYNCVLQQSGTHEELYHDMKDTNCIFPQEMASLIIRKVSSCPLAMISSGDPCANLFGDLDIDRIVEKVHEHTIKIEPGLEQKGLDQGLRQEELSVRIIPHLGKEPINIDPDIVAEHLGVISIKTQSLEKLQTECLARTGHSIETLRRASINGKSYSTEIPAAGNRKKEKRIYLDQMGRLNVKPLETSSRNSFQSLIKPDITKVELLKDVQSKKDLIIRLITHDISQENLENKEESLASDEDEVVLQEVVKEEEFPESPLEDQVKEDMKLTTSTVAHPKPLMSNHSLKKFLSVGKCQPKSSVTIMTEVSPAKQTESEQTLIRTDSNIDVTTSECLTVTNSSWEKKTQLSETEMRPNTEPTHHFIHRMMSASSYNEDLASSSSFDDEHSTDPGAKVTEESLECPCLENLSSLEVLTLYQRRSDLTSPYSSNDGTSDFEKPHTSSRQRSEMMRKKISSTFSKVFSRSNTSVPKPFSPSPPHQERK